MLRIVLLAGVLAGLAWWYFIGGRTISESDVRAFYAAESEAMRKLDAEAMCDMRDTEFVGKEQVTMSGHSSIGNYDKARYCENTNNNIGYVKRLMERSGKEVPLELEIDIKSIVIADDKKSATVEYVQRLVVQGKVGMKSKVVEELNKRNGTVRSLRVDSASEVYGKLGQR
jgi:hypothetical protein